MNLIWYNSNTDKYEYGDSQKFQALERSETSDTLTVLMEFPGYDDVLASKIIGELNSTRRQIATAS